MPRPNLSLCHLAALPVQQSLVVNGEGLDIPDLLSVLVDTPVAAEESHASHARDALRYPLLLVPVRLVHERLCLVVAMEIVRHKVVVSVVTHRRDERPKVVRRSERALLNLLKHTREVGVDRVRAIGMCVAEIVNILGKVSEEEDVVLANLTSDFNLERSISSAFPKVQGTPDIILTLAPSQVPIIKPPFRTNFMLLVPEALSMKVSKTKDTKSRIKK